MLFMAVSTGMYAPEGVLATKPPTGIILRYDRPLGQVARYRVSLDVQGVEVSLGERLPVKWKAEVEISEEVIARGSDGSIWLRVTSRPIKVSDSNGTLANGAAIQWPATRVYLSSRGEVLKAAEPDTEGSPHARERAFASLLTQAAPIVLPEGAVQLGDEWQAENGSARQTNHLVSISGVGEHQTARITSVADLSLNTVESIEELGMDTHLGGEVRETSQLDLLIHAGLTLRHKGRSHIVTTTKTTLALPEGPPEEFVMESDLTLAFNIRLVAVNGMPVHGEPVAGQ